MTLADDIAKLPEWGRWMDGQPTLLDVYTWSDDLTAALARLRLAREVLVKARDEIEYQNMMLDKYILEGQWTRPGPTLQAIDALLAAMEEPK